MGERHVGTFRCLVVQAYGRTPSASVSSLALAPIGGGKEIFLDLCLTVGREVLASVFGDVDEVALTSHPTNLHAVVHMTLKIQPIRQTMGA